MTLMTTQAFRAVLPRGPAAAARFRGPGGPRLRWRLPAAVRQLYREAGIAGTDPLRRRDAPGGLLDAGLAAGLRTAA